MVMPHLSASQQCVLPGSGCSRGTAQAQAARCVHDRGDLAGRPGVHDALSLPSSTPLVQLVRASIVHPLGVWLRFVRTGGGGGAYGPGSPTRDVHRALGLTGRSGGIAARDVPRLMGAWSMTGDARRPSSGTEHWRWGWLWSCTRVIYLLAWQTGTGLGAGRTDSRGHARRRRKPGGRCRCDRFRTAPSGGIWRDRRVDSWHPY
jgi:hypothetical protein